MDEMKASEVAVMATQEMGKFLSDEWKFRFSNAKKTYGTCYRSKKVIKISLPLALLNPIETTRKTVLHEIAHALTPGHGHDRVWKRKCSELGLENEQRCYSSDDVNVPKGKYIYVCPVCGREYHKYRRLKRDYSCSRCNPCKGYDPERKLKLKGD